MNALKKTSAALIAFAMSASAFAGSDLDTRVHELEKKVDMMSTTTAAGTFGPKTALARPETNGKGWFLSFDVLYWQSKLEGSQYTDTIFSTVNTPVVVQGSRKEPQFDWSFAFKAGIGYNFFHDGWDTCFEYTYFQNKASNSVAVQLPSCLGFVGDNNPIGSSPSITTVSKSDFNNGGGAYFAAASSSHLKLKLNDIILDLGRGFFVSKNLSLRPSVGLKASWITLRQNTKYTGGGTAFSINNFGTIVNFSGLGSGVIYVQKHEKFFGLGPRAAVDTKWHLGNNISIYGDVAGALLFGYFKNELEESYSLIPANFVDMRASMHRLVPTVDFGLGLVYDKYIMCDSQHFSVSLGYETQYFWDVSYLGSMPGGLGTTPGGIGMYGVNLKIRWDF